MSGNNHGVLSVELLCLEGRVYGFGFVRLWESLWLYSSSIVRRFSRRLPQAVQQLLNPKPTTRFQKSLFPTINITSWGIYIIRIRVYWVYIGVPLLWETAKNLQPALPTSSLRLHSPIPHSLPSFFTQGKQYG